MKRATPGQARGKVGSTGATSPTDSESPSSSRSLARTIRIASPGLLLAALTFVAYVPALTAGFVWDDQALYDNPAMKMPNGLAEIWLNPGINKAEYHYWPMTYSSFWLEWRLWQNGRGPP